jgi:hypothetical protein
MLARNVSTIVYVLLVTLCNEYFNTHTSNICLTIKYLCCRVEVVDSNVARINWYSTSK